MICLMFFPKLAKDSVLPDNSHKILFNQVEYFYEIVKNIEPKDMKLIANYHKQQAAVDLQKNNYCVYGINGGFYDESQSPIGYLVIDGQQVNKFQNNKVLNTVVGVYNNQIYFDQKVNQNYLFGHQTGPLLINKGSIIDLKLIRDKQARRMVMAKDDTGKVIFLSVNGAYLNDLPELVKEIFYKEKIIVANAVNLDGGNASSMLGPNINFYENNPVGSWWCVTNYNPKK